jgi:hypothetical protein
MGRACSTYGEEAKYVGKPVVKTPLERLKCKWEDNIKMDLREIGWRGMDWI